MEHWVLRPPRVVADDDAVEQIDPAQRVIRPREGGVQLEVVLPGCQAHLGGEANLLLDPLWRWRVGAPQVEHGIREVVLWRRSELGEEIGGGKGVATQDNGPVPNGAEVAHERGRPHRGEES
nr:unnamed protein product [Digitaria exilis]